MFHVLVKYVHLITFESSVPKTIEVCFKGTLNMGGDEGHTHHTFHVAWISKCMVKDNISTTNDIPYPPAHMRLRPSNEILQQQKKNIQTGNHGNVHCNDNTTLSSE